MGYNNVRIKEGDEWKGSLKTIADVEPLVSSSDLRIHLLLPSDMNDTLQDLLHGQSLHLYG